MQLLTQSSKDTFSHTSGKDSVLTILIQLDYEIKEEFWESLQTWRWLFVIISKIQCFWKFHLNGLKKSAHQ